MKNALQKYFIPVALALLFVAPGISAYMVFSHPQWLMAKKTNRGQLLNPPISIGSLGTDSKWRLLLWSPDACGVNCAQQLEKLARIRLALGRRLYNLNTCLLLGENAPSLSDALQHRLQEEDIQVTHLTKHPLLKQSVLPSVPMIYIEDPNGFLVLAYPADVLPKDIFHDIKHLLNVKE